ncbi:unnamed protein product [Boreogadus saida]
MEAPFDFTVAQQKVRTFHRGAKQMAVGLLQPVFRLKRKRNELELMAAWQHYWLNKFYFRHARVSFSGAAVGPYSDGQEGCSPPG